MRQLAVFALCIYCSLLLLASWPVPIDIPAMLRLQSFAESALKKITVYAGLDLFHRDYEETHKVRNQCTTIKGHTVSGHVVELHSTRIACGVDKLTIVPTDTTEIIFHRLTEEAAVDRMHMFDAEGEEALQRQGDPIYIREKAVYQSLGDYYCHSPQVQRHEELEAVTLGWQQGKIEYSTGQTSKPYMLLMKWNCKKHETETIQWSPYISENNLNDFLQNKIW